MCHIMVSALVTRGYITRDSHLIQSQPWTMDLDGPATPSLGELLAESARVLQQTVTIKKASRTAAKGRMGKVMAAGGLQSAAASSVKAEGSGGVVKMDGKSGQGVSGEDNDAVGYISGEPGRDGGLGKFELGEGLRYGGCEGGATAAADGTEDG